MPKKRLIAASDPEASEDEIAEVQPTKTSRTKRSRTASYKQNIIDETKDAQQARENAKLKAKLLKLKKQLEATQARASAKDDDEDDVDVDEDPDRLPPESEDSEIEGVDMSASIRKGPIIPAKSANVPKIRRRDGETQSSLSVQAAPAMPASPASAYATAPAMPSTPAALAMAVVPMTPAPVDPGALAAPAVASVPLSVETSPIPAPFAHGVIPAQGSRPKASEYTDEVKALLLRAIEYYSCSIYTVDAFPSDTKQEEFVASAWKHACDESESQVVYILSERMKRLIGQRKSNARGDISDLLRVHTASTYKFRDGVSKTTERNNKALYEELSHDGTYHHKDTDPTTHKKTGFVQHPYIPKAIRMAFFGKAAMGMGFMFSEAFDPIRTETVALILTVVRFHIEEWKEGKHIRGQFKETDYGQVYTGLLKDINAWASSNETAWKNIRSKWYKRAYRAGGGILPEDTEVRVPQGILDDAQAELLGRSGLTDSEAEAEED